MPSNPLGADRSVATTECPRLASTCAVAIPMPRAAPVIKTLSACDMRKSPGGVVASLLRFVPQGPGWGYFLPGLRRSGEGDGVAFRGLKPTATSIRRYAAGSGDLRSMVSAGSGDPRRTWCRVLLIGRRLRYTLGTFGISGLTPTARREGATILGVDHD